jgi:hypothetical protein
VPVKIFFTGPLSCSKADIRSFATPRQRSEVKDWTEPAEKVAPRAITVGCFHAVTTILNVIKYLWEMILAFSFVMQL